MKKKLLSFVVFVACAGFGVDKYAEKLVLNGLSTAGSAALGTRFSVDSISMALLLGKFGVGGLEVGNPEGFTTPNCFRVDELGVDADLRSFLGDVATIEELRIRGPEVTFEVNQGGTNYGRLLERLQKTRDGDSGPSGAPSKPPAEGSGAAPNVAPSGASPASPSAEPSKKFLVQRLVLEDVRVRLAQSALLSTEMTFVLPTIQLENLGNANASGPAQPLTLPALFEQILGVISLAVTESGGVPQDLKSLLSGELSGASLGRARDAIGGLRESLKKSGSGIEKDLKKDLKQLENQLDGLLGGDNDAEKDAKKDADKKKKKKDKDKDDKNKDDKGKKKDG